MSRKVEGNKPIGLISVNAFLDPDNFPLLTTRNSLRIEGKAFFIGSTTAVLTACAPTPSTPVITETPTQQVETSQVEKLISPQNQFWQEFKNINPDSPWALSQEKVFVNQNGEIVYAITPIINETNNKNTPLSLVTINRRGKTELRLATEFVTTLPSTNPETNLDQFKNQDVFGLYFLPENNLEKLKNGEQLNLVSSFNPSDIFYGFVLKNGIRYEDFTQMIANDKTQEELRRIFSENITHQLTRDPNTGELKATEYVINNQQQIVEIKAFLTPSPEPTPTPSPTPEKITLEKTFGLTGDALKAFRGAERAITRAENGGYLVTAKVRNPETGELEERQLTLDPASFNTHPEITNPLGLDTLQAKDADGNPVTLLWLPETHEFRLAYDLLPIVDPSTIGSETPKIIQENLAALPEIPIQDIQNGLAARSVLLAMKRDGYKPFSDGVIERYKNTPPGSKGSSLYFEQKPDGSKVVWLKHRANDKRPVTTNDSAAIVTPYFYKTKIGGNEYYVSSVAWFDPKDPENPKPEEFKVIFGIFFLPDGIAPLNIERFAPDFFTSSLDPYSVDQLMVTRWAGIYGENLNTQNPELALLAQLLQIKGNDASKLESENPNALYFPSAITYIGDLNNGVYGNVIEMPFPQGVIIPPELQLMLFLFEVGVAQ